MKIDTMPPPPLNEDGATHDGDGKTALIVDDQSDITALVARWLEGSGYHALTASDGKEAQGMMMAKGIANVDLLVTDLAMPRMQGDELARWFIGEDPGARVLVISGDLADTKLCEGVAFLQKPFSREAFMARVDHLLGHSGVPAAIPSSLAAERNSTSPAERALHTVPTGVKLGGQTTRLSVEADEREASQQYRTAEDAVVRQGFMDAKADADADDAKAARKKKPTVPKGNYADE